MKKNKFMDDKLNNINYIVRMCNIHFDRNHEYCIKELNKLLNDKNYKDYYYLCYFYLGRFYASLDNKNEAIKFFTLSIELNNKFFDSYWNRAIIYSFQNKIKKSYKDYKIALSLYNEKDFDNSEKTLFIVAKYRLIATYYNYNKKFKKAIICYKKAVKYNFDVGNLYNSIGVLYHNYKKYNKAIKYYDKAINNSSIIAHFNKSIAYYSLKDYKNALNCINEYFNIKKKGFNSEEYNHKALYNGLIGNIDEAYNYFNESLNLNINNTFHLYNVIYILLNKNSHFKNYFDDLMNKIINIDFNIENDNIYTLYKYRNIDINTLNLITEEKVKISNFNYFNDPADPIIKLQIKELPEIKDMINKIKICSLSSEDDNFLMWSHYANEHKGICIAYDISKIKEYNKTILKKVIYTKKIQIHKPYNHIFENPILNEEKNFISLFYLKHKNWKYEKEYRIITYEDYDFINLPIKAIYFGMNADMNHINLVKNFIKDKNIELYKIKPNENNLFELIKDRIN